jgi:hypothetical protein
VDDSDIVRFNATSLGANTAGRFSMYLDGSDVGLVASNSGHDVDALELLASGDLLLSTAGSVSVQGTSAQDEDLLDFKPRSLGASTAGTFSLYFDGSDVGLGASGGDVDAVAVDGSGRLYLSTAGPFSVPRVNGGPEDVVVFVPNSLGANTAGNYSPNLYFDGSAYGLASNNISDIDLP